MSSSTEQLVLLLRQKLSSARSKLLRVDLAMGVILCVATAFAAWFLLALFEYFFWLSPVLKWSGVGVSLAFVIALAAQFVVRPYLMHLNVVAGREEKTVAKEIGRAYPQVGDRLLNLLQLSEGRHSYSPGPFVDLAVQRLGEPMRDMSFAEVATWKTTLKLSRFAAIPTVLLLAFVISAPGPFFSATGRITQPGTSFERPAPYSLVVSPGNAELIIGGDLDVSVGVDGIAPEEPPVLETIVDGELRSRFVNLAPDSVAGLIHKYENVRQAFRYRVTSESVNSEWFEVSMVERPLVQQLNVRLSFPSYTRIPAQSLDTNIGDFAALTGTRASVNLAISGAEASRAWLEFDSGRTEELTIDGNSASTQFSVRRNDIYRVRLESPDGISNLSPITYRVENLPDASPSATLLAPGSLVDLNDEMLIPLLVHITDDFGFNKLDLFYRLSDSRFGEISETFSKSSISLTSPFQLDQDVAHDWAVSASTELDPVPGDIIDYYLEIWDNDGVTGSKPAQTRIFQLRMPSLAEQYEALDSSEDETQSSLEDLLEAADEARNQFEELKEQLLENPDADFHEERLLDQLQEKQENLENSVDTIADQMQELAEQMENNDLVSEETLGMFEELQEVVDEVRTPELMDALTELQDALENMDLNQMQDALEKFEFSEDMYQERLERTLDLFKKFRVDQDMEEIEQRAEDLAETEDKLAEETAKLENEQQQESSGENEQPGEKNEDLAQQQEMAAEDMKALEEKMEEVRERMEELDNMPSQEMQDLLEDTQDQQMSEQMEQNAEELRENELQDAGEQQQQMSQQLNQLSSQMNDMQMAMQGAQMQLNIAAIRASLEDILTLSEQQESLRRDVLSLASDSPLLRRAAQDQVDLVEGLSIVSDSLQSISREIPQMTRDIQQRAGDSMREMGDATAALTERAARRAAGHQRGAMSNLNELALMLSELLNQQMNGSGTGQSNQSMEQMMEQLQQMGQQQQQLNQQVQQLLNDMQGQRLTQDMTDRLRQMGSQQEQIRNELRQMSRNRDTRNKVLGDLNRIADQMMESIQELQQNRVSRRTVQRQQQILTRLLEASQSMEQKGKDKKREGKTAEEILRESPASLSPSEQLERLRRDLIRALETGYSTDYEALIRRYFELLQSNPDS